MLGQGLESLIPPQKPQSGNVGENQKQGVSDSSSDSLMPAAREEKIDTSNPPIASAPLISKKNSTPEINSNGSSGKMFLPENEEEELLPEPPPAMIHRESSSVIAVPADSSPKQSFGDNTLGAMTESPVVIPSDKISPAESSVSSHVVTTVREESKTVQTAEAFPRPDLKKIATGEAVFLVEVDKIKPNPHQPRRNFDESALKDLSNSIREHGILQPLVVTKIETEITGGTSVEYQLIAGERRLLASKMIGLERVPVIIRTLDRGANQSLELAIIENLQREDLNPIEMARAFARLQDEFRMTQREIATRLGKSRETVANTLRLLDLPFDVQEAIALGKISESHGRLLLSLKDPAVQDKLFRDLVNKSLTTRELKAKVEAGDIRRREKKAVPELQMFQERLASFLGAPVKINQTGESGRITINYYSHEELENILEHLARVIGEDLVS